MPIRLWFPSAPETGHSMRDSAVMGERDHVKMEGGVLETKKNKIRQISYTGPDVQPSDAGRIIKGCVLADNSL